MKPDIAIIAAMAKNRVIGIQGALPWHLPEDLKRFKQLTSGHPVIMGRKTFESIVRLLGKPLPGRRNIVVTRSAQYSPAGAEAVASLDNAIDLVREQRAFVIGGAEIYSLALPLAELMYLTEIEDRFDGDAWFPEFDRADWLETARESGKSAARLSYNFVDYRRKPNRSEIPGAR